MPKRLLFMMVVMTVLWGSHAGETTSPPPPIARSALMPSAEGLKAFLCHSIPGIGRCAAGPNEKI